MVVTTPTGKSVFTRVWVSKFAVLNLQINTGDEVMWDNLDETTYTLVEMDRKIGNMTLPNLGKAKYIFNTSGNYKIGLNDKYMQQLAIQDINVVSPIISSISTPSETPVVTNLPVSPTVTTTQIIEAIDTSISTPTPAAPGLNFILTITGIITAFILRQRYK